ncbi:MAG: cytochrome c family protein [Acidimicrobiia bacterium]
MRPRARRRAGTVRRALLVSAVAAGLLGVASCGLTGVDEPIANPTVVGGDAELGRRLLAGYGCGACHSIPGVRGADGLVGPPLDRFGARSYIAGALVNNQPNLMRWIMDPQRVEPGTAMPDLGVSEDDARDISAYLASLR